MEEYNQYILEWRDKVIEADKCLQNQDFEGYEACIQEANEAYEKYKRDTELTYEYVNFGMANHIFEDALPKLHLEKKFDVIEQYISCIKEDKNLLAQYQFYKALDKYNESYDLNSYLNEALDLAKKKIDKSSIKASNKKLGKILSENNIKPNDFIDEEKLSFYDNCNTLLIKDKKLTNITEMTESTNAVCEYMKSVSAAKENTFNLQNAINEFTKKLNKTLTDEEKELVEMIIGENGGYQYDTHGKSIQNNNGANNTQPQQQQQNNNGANNTQPQQQRKGWYQTIGKYQDDEAEEARKNRLNQQNTLFNQFRQNCIDTINTMVYNTSELNEQNDLKNVKEQLERMTYNPETIVEDIIKLLEIKDVLMS